MAPNDPHPPGVHTLGKIPFLLSMCWISWLISTENKISDVMGCQF